jgi:hypothetical protein
MTSIKLSLPFLLFVLATLPGVTQDAPSPAKSNKGSATATVPGDSRTLDDTFGWIQRQVEKSSGSSYQVTYSEKGYKWHHTNAYGNVQLNECVMVFDQTFQNNARPPRGIQYSVPLWDLASATYEVDRGSKQFKYDPGIAALFLRSHSKSMHWKRPKTYVATDLVEIEFGPASSLNQAKVNKVAKAFMHLGALCASQAPKSSSAGKPPTVEAPAK